MEQKGDMGLDSKTVMFSLGVAEYMRKHAGEYDIKDADRMYVLGLIHDIGLISAEKEHAQYGANLFNTDNQFRECIFYHNATPEEYMEQNLCSASEIPPEMILLWTAVLSIGETGGHIGFESKLEEIKGRYGSDSIIYKKADTTIFWLKTRQEVHKTNKKREDRLSWRHE